MITTTDILTRLFAAAAADSALLGVVQSGFGPGAVLSLQLGPDPTREVTTQDCPLIAFFDGGPAETGRHSETWAWPLELHIYVSTPEVTDSAPAPWLRLRTVSGPGRLDALAAALRAVCLDTLQTLGLSERDWTTDLEPARPDTWPRQRAIISLTVTRSVCLGEDPVLATEEPA